MNLNKIIIYIAFFLVFYFKSASNDIRSIDSFFKLSEKHIEENFEEFILSYINLKSDSTLKIFKKVASKIQDKESREYVMILTQISSTHSKMKDSANFERTYQSALDIANNNDYFKEKIDLYIIRAEYFKDKDLLDSALYYCLIAEEVSKKIDNYNSYRINHILGDIYYYLEMYDEAKVCYYKVIESGDKLPTWIEWRKIVIYTDLGNIFTFQGNYQFALQHYNIALDQYFENKKTKSYYQAYIQGAHLFSRIANMYFENDNLDSAKSLPVK